MCATVAFRSTLLRTVPEQETALQACRSCGGSWLSAGGTRAGTEMPTVAQKTSRSRTWLGRWPSITGTRDQTLDRRSSGLRLNVVQLPIALSSLGQCSETQTQACCAGLLCDRSRDSFANRTPDEHEPRRMWEALIIATIGMAHLPPLYGYTYTHASVSRYKL